MVQVGHCDEVQQACRVLIQSSLEAASAAQLVRSRHSGRVATQRHCVAPTVAALQHSAACCNDGPCVATALQDSAAAVQDALVRKWTLRLTEAGGDARPRTASVADRGMRLSEYEKSSQAL